MIAVVDTPSVKQFVFGTDPLTEIRGASALLDRLNRHDTESILRQFIEKRGGKLEKIYANGGSAQFLFSGCPPAEVEQSLNELVRFYHQETGNEVNLVYGLATMEDASQYQQKVRQARFDLRCRREMEERYRVSQLHPIFAECSSSSHLPASRRLQWDNESPQFLSDSSDHKREVSRMAREQGMWAELDGLSEGERSLAGAGALDSNALPRNDDYW